MTLGVYRYSLKGMGAGSAKFGPCEVCREPVAEVCYQVEEQAYRDDGEIEWRHLHRRGVFGHESCLLQERR